MGEICRMYSNEYSDGFDAYMHCEGIRSNPYKSGTKQYNDFIIGYSDAAHQRDYDPKRTVEEALR